MKSKPITISVSDSIGKVSGALIAPQDMDFLYVFAHGAGAGMDHPFMEKLSQALAERGIGTLRYNFPYMEKGGKRPDVPAVAEKTVNRAIDKAAEMYPESKLLAGGKSFGGRMTSQLMAKTPHARVKGIVFVGFPLHAAGSPGTERSKHLTEIRQPMLFLQGSRDALAQWDLIEEVCSQLPLATLNRFEGADHSFKAGKQDLIPALAESFRKWIDSGM